MTPKILERFLPIIVPVVPPGTSLTRWGGGKGEGTIHYSIHNRLFIADSYLRTVGL